MKQIAEIVDRKKSTVTTLEEKLITLGYAEKNVDETDNRVFIISLTEKGRGLKDVLIDVSKKHQHHDQSKRFDLYYEGNDRPCICGEMMQL